MDSTLAGGGERRWKKRGYWTGTALFSSTGGSWTSILAGAPAGFKNVDAQPVGSGASLREMIPNIDNNNNNNNNQICKAPECQKTSVALG